MQRITISTLAWEAPLNAFDGIKEGNKVTVKVTVRCLDLDNAIVDFTAVVNRFEFNLLIGSRNKYQCTAKIERVNGVVTISNIHKLNNVDELVAKYLGI